MLTMFACTQVLYSVLHYSVQNKFPGHAWNFFLGIPGDLKGLSSSFVYSFTKLATTQYSTPTVTLMLFQSEIYKR